MLELERRLGLTSIIAISLATLGAFFVIPGLPPAHRSEHVGCVWDRRDLRLASGAVQG